MEDSVVDVKEPILTFILEYAADRGVTEVKDDEPLLTTNIIDSLGSFRLIAFLEGTFPTRRFRLHKLKARCRCLRDDLIAKRWSALACCGRYGRAGKQ